MRLGQSVGKLRADGSSQKGCLSTAAKAVPILEDPGSGRNTAKIYRGMVVKK